MAFAFAVVVDFVPPVLAGFLAPVIAGLTPPALAGAPVPLEPAWGTWADDPPPPAFVPAVPWLFVADRPLLALAVWRELPGTRSAFAGRLASRATARVAFLTVVAPRAWPVVAARPAAVAFRRAGERAPMAGTALAAGAATVCAGGE
jgi:hypothetical protein